MAATGKTKKNSAASNALKAIIIVAFFALIVLAAFYILNNRQKTVEQDVERVSPVKELLIRNLDDNYPATPKEVVKLYSEITRCFYAEEYSEEELVGLAKMSRQLFDEELAANQTEESYIRALRSEIAQYKQEDRMITSYSLASSADVQFYDFLGDEWAQLIALYSVRTGTKVEPSKERFLLRKDDAGHWKIYGFRLEQFGQKSDE